MEPKPRVENLSKSATLCKHHQHLKRVLEKGVVYGRKVGEENPLYMSGCHTLFIKDATPEIPAFPRKVGFGGCKDCHATRI